MMLVAADEVFQKSGKSLQPVYQLKMSFVASCRYSNLQKTSKIWVYFFCPLLNCYILMALERKQCIKVNNKMFLTTQF